MLHIFVGSRLCLGITKAMHGEQFSEKNIYRKLLIFYYNSRPYELKFLLVLSLNPRRVYEAILKPVFAAKKITFGQIK